MKVKNIDLFKIAELINQLNPEADVSSINFYGNDISVNSSFSLSSVHQSEFEVSLSKLNQLINELEEH